MSNHPLFSKWHCLKHPRQERKWGRGTKETESSASTEQIRRMSKLEAILALDDLPAEVLFLITGYLGGQDLKHLRLSCKYLASIVEPRLFEDIVVVPYQKSFQALSSLANHGSLRTHVQSVTYDCRRLAVEDEPTHDLTSTKIYAMSATVIINRSGTVDMTDVLVQRHTLQNTFLYPESGATAEEEQLRSCFSAFVKLRRVVVQGSHEDKLHSNRAPRFHEQMVVKAQLMPNSYAYYPCKRRLEFILAALHKSGCAISDLWLENVDWLGLGPLRDVLGSIKHLRLCFENAAPHGMSINSAYHKLGLCLNHPVRNNLQNLEISIRPSKLWLEELEQVDLKEIVLWPAYIFNSACHYPGLRKLYIGKYYTYEHDLLEFLAGASPTLRSLSLEHIGLLADRKILGAATTLNNIMTSPAWIRSPSGCWVKVIKFLQSKMKLEHVSFLGTLASSNQRWACRDQNSAHRKWLDSFNQISDRGQLRGILNSYPERDGTRIVGWIDSSDGATQHLLYDRQNCLRSRIQRFIVEGGDCPLDSLAVLAQLDGKGFAERMKLGKGDYSWEIISPALAQVGPTEELQGG